MCILLRTQAIRNKVAGLRVNRVTKIHNRLLRNTFEQHLERMPQFDPTGEDPARPELHYLFVGESARQPHGLLRVAQDGQQRVPRCCVPCG